MSAAAARLVALPFALLAFGLRVALTFWLIPLTWRLESGWVALPVWIALLVATIALPLSGYVLLTRGPRRRRATWTLEAPRFTAATSVGRAAQAAVVTAGLTGGLLVTERVPGGDRMRIAHLPGAVPLSIAGVVLGLTAATFLALRRHPALSLDPQALTVRRLRGTLRLGWDELLPGGPPRPAKRQPNALVVYRMRPGGPEPVNLPAGWLQVDSAFLAHTIRYYADHPDRRATIGSAAGLQELESSFVRT